MKLFQLVTAFAVTAFTVATSPGSGDESPARRASVARQAVNDLAARNPGAVSHYSHILAYYKKGFTSRDEDHENIPELAEAAGDSCSDWKQKYKKTQCARPWAPECEWDCAAKLCKDGPSECHKGGALGPKYCGSRANGHTSSGSSVTLLVRQDDQHTNEANEKKTETTAGCDQCDSWMNDCKSKCPHPNRPECRWKCLAALCAGRGPAECRGGAACGSASGCLKDAGSSNAPQARDDGDGWDEEECNEYTTGCVDAFCRDPLHNGPNSCSHKVKSFSLA
ncbi:uncharacterized protein CC84DRAFT_1263042 [Paraphaeosphaeria sporulosa]|uniref:Uncharacterized protein n=1 Tax=Paraphaeosphaeria sporulosa TaxID=1460663 RepID=A0A177C0N7_9PLEO|nr:uncharacterized protein CC84DRAFT_1263042 [Paraphaeosphaeria sporulosa]OAG00976.1 hypothetical protein CC84DRAFT_1263042 [Paraphaeosphaeria sporulosa]